jgi:multidrug efflux pump
LMATLSASLFMALIFIPTLGSVFGKGRNTNKLEAVSGISEDDHKTVLEAPGLTGMYISVLAASLQHPGKLLVVSVLLLFAIFATFINLGKGIEFFPDVEPEFAKLQVKARGNLAVLEKDQLMAQVEERIIAINDIHHEIDTIYLRTGAEENSLEAEDIIGTISLEFSPWDQRRKADVILAEIRHKTKDLAGIIVDRRVQKAGPPVGKAFQIQLSSRTPEAISPMINKVLIGLSDIGGFTNVEDSRPLPGIDWELKTDRAQAAKFGASIDLIGRMVKLVSTGIKLGEYRPDDTDDELEIRARYPEAYRTLDQLDNIRAMTPMGKIPISNFVKRDAKPRTGKLQRSDGKRVMTIKADVEEGQLPDDKVKQVIAWLKGSDFDPRVSVTFKGENEEQKRAQQFLRKALAIALFIMAVILVTQFNSFYSAGLILFAVVMSTGGVLIGLMITDQPFGIVMNGISVIALAGIVVNNNIVLIDTYDRLKKTEVDPLVAILKTGAQRLRPVMLTTITTILGLLPMVLGVNIDFITRSLQIGAPSSQWWQQLSTAIVFGLGFATILTLLITPAALMVRVNIRAWIGSRKV